MMQQRAKPAAGRSRFTPRFTPGSSESGFVLLAVLIMLALLFIALSMAVPKVITELRRDKEAELYHRGMQYAHAIRFYYKKFGRYPGSIEQLENTNDIRFLRHRYKDPMTGKDDWRLIHFGEATVPPTGLFGQPLQSAATAGQASIYATPPNPDGTPANGTTPDPNNPVGSSSPTGSMNPTGSNNPLGSSNPTNSTGIGSPMGGGTGADLGGGPIVGVASSSTKASIRLFRQQTHYNQWEFLYDPLEDTGMGANSGAGLAQQPGTTNLNGASPIGSPSPTSPTSPNYPTSPQQ
jgi:type II secretory pathway pseudopilin PulG